MPMYTYHCENCDYEFEKYQSFSEDALDTCPNCKQESLYKVYKPALVLFKGSGFYVTDSKSHSSTMNVPSSSDNSNNNNNNSNKTTNEKPSDTKKSETKKAESIKETKSKE